MYPPVVCFCGRELGCLYELFHILRCIRYSEEFGDEVIDPSILGLMGDLKIELGDILDDLGIHMECCRSRMLTWVEIKELY